MADITASMVKDLRAKTGTGMMDCKKALVECDGDMETAVDWLRKKGLSAAAKKSDRVAAEGLVAVASAGNKAVALEVNAETDFVSRNDQFQAFVAGAAKTALETGEDFEALKAGKSEELTQLIATVGENMNMRRMQTLSVSQGVVASYVHNAVSPGLGKIGVLVALESSADEAALSALGKQLAMHVAATSPIALSTDDVDADMVEREKKVHADQARESGKPEQIIEKMVEGRMRKYFAENVFLEQTYVVDGETQVKAVIENASKELGVPVKLTSFARFALGEGIEKEAGDFAAEVASMAN